MKYLALLSLVFFTSISLAQNTGIIEGKTLDNELNNTPLAFATISIVGKATSITSDISGSFVFEDLQEGKYTVVCSFPGYETQELEVEVSAFEPTQINVSLASVRLPQIELAVN